MKYILLLLLSFNLQAQVINCGLNTHEEIDACTIEDKLPMLIKSLYPDLNYRSYESYMRESTCDPETVDIEETETVEECSPWDQKTGFYTYQDQVYVDDLPTLSLYERFITEQKPVLSVFETGLLTWKASEKIKLDFKNSIKGMKDFRRRARKCGFHQANMALLKKKIIKNKDITKRDCMVSKTEEIEQEDSLAELEAQIVKDIRFGQKLQVKFLLAERIGVKGMNRSDRRQRSKRLHQKLKSVKNLLSSGNIGEAKDEMILIEADADLPQSAKDKVTALFNNYLGE